MKTIEDMVDEKETIEKFRNLCIPSLPPDQFENLDVIIETLYVNRHLEKDCPTCGSTIVDGKCSDVGDNNCGYTTE